ncbi:uncharacterized protein PAF06_001216 [Gastrophryne carolinensis]
MANGSALRMDKEQSQVTERILKLTLEIIYLLTGEDYTVVKKSKDGNSDTKFPSGSEGLCLSQPPSCSVISRRRNGKKILEVTTKIIELINEEEEESHDSDAPEHLEDSDYSPIEVKAVSAASDDELDDLEEEDFQTFYISEDRRTVMGDNKLLVVTCRVCGELFAAKSPESSEPLKCLKCSILEPTPEKNKTRSREELLRSPKNSNIGTETLVIDYHVIGKKVVYEGHPEDRGHKPLPGEKVLICEVCGRFFAQQGALDIHRRIHTGEKPFICMKCGKGFRSKGNLVSHQTVHTDDKQFQCPICEKFFKRSLGLIEHMRLHTGEKPFTCHDCGKCFSQRSAFSTHQKIHADGKVFTCFDCGRCFKTKADLRTHELVHLGDKPFQCTECGEGFTRRANLLRHQRSHSGVKPFSCPDCGKTFTRKLGLLKHERLHLREEEQARFQASMAFAAAQASM